jgi:hypothetical protein
MSRNYRNWIEAYVRHTRYSESPDNFHFWTGVATVAGALRRRVWIDQRIFQWVPNFYIILVGPPGVAAKSTSIRQGISLLEKVEGINFGPQSMTWQSLAQDLERYREAVDMEDGTVEVMSCVTISISELGTFLKADDDSLISTLIAMWDGQKESFKHSTKTQGSTEILNPWVNLIGCTTPAWIRANVPTSMVGGGLTSRIIFVYGEQKRQLVAYPGSHVPSLAFQEERDLLIQDLTQIAMLKGEYKLSDEATKWGEEWYVKLNKVRPEHMRSDRFDGYIARKQTHLHKLAIVFAAAKRDTLIIEKEDLEEADLAITDIEFDMLKVFNSIGITPAVQNTIEIKNLIRNAKQIEYAHLWRIMSKTVPLKEFMEAIKGLIASNEIELKEMGGYKTVIYKPPPDDST